MPFFRLIRTAFLCSLVTSRDLVNLNQLWFSLCLVSECYFRFRGLRDVIFCFGDCGDIGFAALVGLGKDG